MQLRRLSLKTNIRLARGRRDREPIRPGSTDQPVKIPQRRERTHLERDRTFAVPCQPLHGVSHLHGVHTIQQVYFFRHFNGNRRLAHLIHPPRREFLRERLEPRCSGRVQQGRMAAESERGEIERLRLRSLVASNFDGLHHRIQRGHPPHRRIRRRDEQRVIAPRGNARRRSHREAAKTVGEHPLGVQEFVQSTRTGSVQRIHRRCKAGGRWRPGRGWSWRDWRRSRSGSNRR